MTDAAFFEGVTLTPIPYGRIRHPHIYGIDLASPSDLIAHECTVDETVTYIGAEKVIFQELDDLIDACRRK